MPYKIICGLCLAKLITEGICTDRQEIFEKVNELLENAGIEYQINDVDSLEEFLDNVENQQYEEYDEIEKLYNDLMELSYYDDGE